LLVEGTTMSKSKGNYYTLSDLVEKGYSPMAVRYALLTGHPRKQLNFTLDSLHAAESALKSLTRYHDALSAKAAGLKSEPSARFDAVLAALREDLNMPHALGELFGDINLWQPEKQNQQAAAE